MDENLNEHNYDLPKCPVCYSDQTELLTEHDRIYAVGMYEIHSVVNLLDRMFDNCYCPSCGYTWYAMLYS